MDYLSKRTSDRLGWRLWLVCFFVFSFFYLLTCQRGLSWQDSGWFQMRILVSDYRGTANNIGDWGIAVAHPLFIFMGRIAENIPFGSLFVRLNFLSGLGMAVALSNLAGIITFLTKDRLAGILTASIICVTHSVWWLSTITEVYTWSLAGLTIELYILLLLISNPRGVLVVLLALVSGLGFSMHNFALLPLPIYLVVLFYLLIKRKLSWWILLPAFVAYVAGSSFIIGLMINVYKESGDIFGVIRSTLVGNFAEQVTNASFNWRHLKSNVALVTLNFINILVPAFVLGIIKGRKLVSKSYYFILLAIGIIQLAFFARYPVPDQFTFILPTLSMIAIFAGIGIAWLISLSVTWRNIIIFTTVISIVASVSAYALLPGLISRTGINVQRRRTLPYRNEVRYWLVPWKHNENSAQRFAVEALKQIEPDSVVMVDTTTHNPLLLAQHVYDISPEITIQSDAGPLPVFNEDPKGFYLAVFDRPLYAVSFHQSYISSSLMENVEAQREEGKLLYRLKWKKSLPFLTNQSDKKSKR